MQVVVVFAVDLHVLRYGEDFCWCFFPPKLCLSCLLHKRTDVRSEEKRHVVLPKKEDMEEHILNPWTFCPKFHVCKEE
jgi:hypothetical protein